MIKRTHIARQEEQVQENGLQIRDIDPNAPFENQLWLNLANNSINLARSGTVIKLNDTAFVESITLTADNIANRSVNLSRPLQNPSKTKIFPEGGPAQIYGVDFVVVFPNKISWENKGLEPLLEAGDVLVIEYS
jgi:hypothetical protein